MTHTEALVIRQLQLDGYPVSQGVLEEAVKVIRESASMPRRRGKGIKFRLPRLAADIRDRCNSLLLFNLGRALRRTEV